MQNDNTRIKPLYKVYRQGDESKTRLNNQDFLNLLNGIEGLDYSEELTLEADEGVINFTLLVNKNQRKLSSFITSSHTYRASEFATFTNKYSNFLLSLNNLYLNQ